MEPTMQEVLKQISERADTNRQLIQFVIAVVIPALSLVIVSLAVYIRSMVKAHVTIVEKVTAALTLNNQFLEEMKDVHERILSVLERPSIGNRRTGNRNNG